MKNILLSLLCLILSAITANHTEAYNYPLRDPYVATIVGTPEEFQPALPEKIDYELLSLKVFPDRTPPDVFWYQRDFLIDN